MKTEPPPFPVCLCKGGETHDITRMCDPVRIFLCEECGGIRREEP